MNSLPNSVKLAVKKHSLLLREGIKRLESGTISAFDRKQLLSSDDRLAMSKEIAQKMLGPDYQIKAIKVTYGMLGQLKEMGLKNFALYSNLMEPALTDFYHTLTEKYMELIFND